MEVTENTDFVSVDLCVLCGENPLGANPLVKVKLPRQSSLCNDFLHPQNLNIGG